MNNIFQIPSNLGDQEIFETILANPTLKVERIISSGQVTEAGKWYDQQQDEWVILLQGEAQLSYEDGRQINLKKGDYLLIHSHQKHRVDYTSNNPPCIWLAIHSNLMN
ncbi:Cupin 2 conserved barrel domain protein [Rippkaea orientalis PCC 8801]|uniref:Cupin 2 conserved barrel domain protein n=1 Tax=Rippkaea orientalis (strain PCC 8801 / RF-1) TaxID=41431 RepID=B7K1G9_RIPO1|nr:cupin domain-containing protein [Rippkaea orientalis]ACK67511.1 Cupin 2 conserved barrel domain protein [Rippkaea orientalis PCC 8801]